VLFQFWVLFDGRSRIRIGWSRFRLRAEVMARLIRVSVPGIVQFLVSTASWTGLIRIISSFGSQALAGYVLSIRVAIFAFLPAWGLCNAAATLVGQNLGAGKPDRSEQAVYRAGFYNMIFLGTIALVFIIFAPGIMHIFSTDPAVVRYGVNCLRIVSAGYIHQPSLSLGPANPARLLPGARRRPGSQRSVPGDCARPINACCSGSPSLPFRSLEAPPCVTVAHALSRATCIVLA
jgi:Na+-driven multidrug efflux pump